MISRGDIWFNKKAYWNKCDGGGDNQIKGAPRWTWHWMLRKNKWQIKMQIKRKNRKGTKRGTDKSSPRPETSTQCTLFRGTLAHWSKKNKNKTENKTRWFDYMGDFLLVSVLLYHLLKMVPWPPVTFLLGCRSRKSAKQPQWAALGCGSTTLFVI